MKSARAVIARLFLLMLAPNLVNAAEVKLPDSAVGQRAAALLDLIAHGDETGIRKFIGEQFAPRFRDSFPINAHVEQLQSLQRALASPELLSVDLPEPDAASAKIRSGKTGKTYVVELATEPAAAGGIVGMNWRPVDDRPLVAFASEKELDEVLQREAAENRFSGVVMIADNREAKFAKGYGFADKSNRLPNTADTRFSIGSIVKLFTSTAIMQLAERGKLKLDDTIGKYLPGFPPAIADKVTIRHLLTMRSGWSSYWFNEDYERSWKNLRTVDSYLAFIRKIPLEFAPGTAEVYSNTGFVVLGGVIEQVSGESYYDYIQKNIFEPAGMRDSGFFERDLPVAHRAIGYTNLSPWGPDAGYQRENTFMIPPKGAPPGDCYATAVDLVKFAQATVTDRLLSKSGMDEVLRHFESAAAPLDRSTFYMGQFGGAPGVSAALWLGAGPTLVVLSNYDEPIAEELSHRMLESLPLFKKAADTRKETKP